MSRRHQSYSLLDDPMLAAAPVRDGFKVLAPAVLVNRLARHGGGWSVYRGRHMEHGQELVIKCLDPMVPEHFGGLLEERVRPDVAVVHPHVVRVLGTCEAPGFHAVLTESIRGEQALERRHRRGPQSDAEVLAMLRGVTAGVAELHRRGIVHGRLGPNSAMVSTDGVVRLDLGISRLLFVPPTDLSLHDRRTWLMDRVLFVPPEQWDTDRLGPEADVWALGATALFMFHHVFSHETSHAKAERLGRSSYPKLRTLRPDTGPFLQELLDRCLCHDPAARFADAGALLRAMGAFGPEDQRVLRDAEAGGSFVGRRQPGRS